MDAEPARPWTIPELARVSGVSPAHFARTFRIAFGLPPHRYLLTRRLERAAAMLVETELSVTEIALETGWKSLGSFSRTFRDVMGTPPTRHRAEATHASRDIVPACHQRAAERPVLEFAVSEKRRREAQGTEAAED